MWFISKMVVFRFLTSIKFLLTEVKQYYHEKEPDYFYCEEVGLIRYFYEDYVGTNIQFPATIILMCTKFQ